MTDPTPEREPPLRQWTGFWSMILQQTANAFNGNLAQSILIPLGAAVGFLIPIPLVGTLSHAVSGPAGDNLGIAVESAAGVLIALSFVLFAPVAGWISDRFSKRDVMLGSAILQTLILAGICGAMVVQSMSLALVGFFALAVQSAVFSPAKLGINKELVGSNHLGFATGIQQMTAMLAMLAGQIVAGGLFDHRYHLLGGISAISWRAAYGPLLVLTIFSLGAWVMAWLIPRVPAQGEVKFTRRLVVSHFAHLADLWRNASLRRASFGVAFFWGFVTFLNLWSVKLAKVLTGGGEGFGTLSSIFMASASLGMAAGFGFTSWLLRKRIELGWVPVAGVAMTLASLALVFIAPGSAHEILRVLDTDPLSFVLGAPRSALFLLALSLLAFVSALFLAPLNAWMQDHYPSDKRGELQSAVNLQDCLSGMIAVAVISGFELGAKALGVNDLDSFHYQMLFIAVVCLVATLLIIRILPADLIRLLGATLVRVLYHVRITGSRRVPSVGGVLLLPNHVTFADAFFLSAACPRPVRFVMDEVFMAKRHIRLFTSIFDTMTIRRNQPLEAIREVIRALRQGDVVCLFPEGQLTRTGSLCPLQRGFELIVRKSGHPIIPVWVDGSWGSIFSGEGGRFFRKFPHRLDHGMTVAFGAVMMPQDATIESLRQALLMTSSLATGRRFLTNRWLKKQPLANNHATKAFRALVADARVRMWANGHQIGMTAALPRRQVIHALSDDPILTTMLGLFAAFPELYHTELRLHALFDGDHDGVWIGGDFLRYHLQHTQITASQLVFHDFSSDALKPVERAGVCHCPGLAIDGVVIAMSMPHPPPAGDDDFPPQKGHKPHSWGKLLPGWHLKPSDHQLMVCGPAATADGYPLPVGCTLDEECFLIAAPTKLR